MTTITNNKELLRGMLAMAGLLAFCVLAVIGVIA
jgi:hypothetical protein